jgi:hypothetical protein
MTVKGMKKGNMVPKTEAKASAPTRAPQPAFDSSAAIELYSNFVAANASPVDFNLLFGHGTIPHEPASAGGGQVPWPTNVKYLAKIAIPLGVLPPLIKLLQMQLERLKAAGVAVPDASASVEVKP